MAFDFRKVVGKSYFHVCFCFRKSGTYTVAGDVRSPPPLLLSAAVVLLCLCEDEALSRTQQARCAAVCCFMCFW